LIAFRYHSSKYVKLDINFTIFQKVKKYFDFFLFFSILCAVSENLISDHGTSQIMLKNKG
jgi:hypothetical protein